MLERQVLLRCGCEVRNSVAMNPQVFFLDIPKIAAESCKQRSLFLKEHCCLSSFLELGLILKLMKHSKRYCFYFRMSTIKIKHLT